MSSMSLLLLWKEHSLKHSLDTSISVILTFIIIFHSWKLNYWISGFSVVLHWNTCMNPLYSPVKYQVQNFKNLNLTETKKFPLTFISSSSLEPCPIYFTTELRDCNIYKHYHTEKMLTSEKMLCSTKHLISILRSYILGFSFDYFSRTSILIADCCSDWRLFIFF